MSPLEGSELGRVVRSALYVPGTRLDMVDKALRKGADQVIVDLEDSVPAQAKIETRHAVAEYVAGLSSDVGVWVRVNPGSDGVRDAESVAQPALRGICISKAEDPGVVGEVAAKAAAVAGRSVPVEPLVESAAAVAGCDRLAGAPGVVRLQLGEADLAADVGVREGYADAGLAYARSRVVFTSAAYGLYPPLAPVEPDFRDLLAFERSTRHLRGLGFVGRVCIHPAQVVIANKVFTPLRSEVVSAEVLVAALDAHAASGHGAFVGTDGRMVDPATVRSARRTLAVAEQFGIIEDSEEGSR